MADTTGMTFATKDVFVFPCVSRSFPGDDKEGAHKALNAKLMSEKNISNIIRCVTTKKSFVINHTSNEIEFVLSGYYFKISNFDTYTETSPIYVQLVYKDDTDMTLIEGDDTNGVNFGGVSLTYVEPTSGEYLCIWDGEEAPPESFAKFTDDSFLITSLDCGELN